MKLFCINCVQSFDAADAVARDSSGNVVSLNSRRGSRLKRWMEYLDGGGDAANRAHNVLELAARGYKVYCPWGCEVPEQMVQRPSRIIGIVGEPATSKTSVLVSMVTKVANDPYIAEHLTVALSSDSSAEWGNRARLQFSGRTSVEASPGRLGLDTLNENPDHYWQNLEQRVPLVIEVTGRKASSGGVNLVFLDVAGEETLDAEGVARMSPHLAVADQLWFFLTPNINDEIREQLATGHTDAAESTALARNELNQNFVRSQSMIRNVARLWKVANNRPPDSRVGSPRLTVLVALAKADQLTQVRLNDSKINELIARVAPPNDWITSNSVQANLYSPNEIAARSEDTCEIVKRLYPQIANSILDSFPEAVFVPVAATGNPARSANPDDPSATRKYQAVKPYGVIDLFIAATSDIRELGVSE